MTSCSTEKAKWSNVAFHNTTCHYNVWWNGNESLKAGVEKLAKNAPDDYTTFLPVERLGSADAARTINPEMDRAVEKGVKGIKKHSIFVGGQEHVPYIKECYLLTAYATFYKQDYAATANTASILVSQFGGTHAADEGAVLMARCMSREKRYTEAEATLDQLAHELQEGRFGKQSREKLYLAMVEATVPQEKYKKAVEYIHLALDCTRSRDTKARLNFLLAQIYQSLDRRSIAAKYYRRVVALGPEYVMEFNARLGEASCADLSTADIPKLERQLDAMLRERKNYEYRDQIYYAKGMMYLGVKDAKRACDNLRRSVAVAAAGSPQKAKSALELGRVLYEVYENYEQAQPYYDTAMQCLAADYPGYASIRRRRDVLDELCSYTRAFHRGDSLLAVAAMSDEERDSLIMAKIDTLVAQEKRAAEQARLDALNAGRRAQQNTLKGDWYFYNQSTAQKGRDAFVKTWGDRPLEDNWFLSSKQSLGMMSLADNTQQADSSTADGTEAGGQSTAQAAADNPNDPHSKAFYLKELPATQHAIDSLDSLIAINLLGAGYLYYDGVHNIPLALECYHRLADSYAGFEQSEQTLYMLYRIYDKMGNTPQANYYRDMVLMGFPDGDFANIIRDNEYYKELLRREGIVEQAYAELYDNFQLRQYEEVIDQAELADDLYGGHPMLGKFRYWKGLALAAVGDREAAISTLEGLVNSVPRSDTVHMLALSQLEYLRADSSKLEMIKSRRQARRDDRAASRQEQPRADRQGEDLASTDTELPPEAQVFRHRQGQQYYVIVLLNDRRLKGTEVQYRMADFNSEYYSNMSYQVNATLFNDTTHLLTIHRFKNEEAAMGYYHHLLQDESPLRRYSEDDYRVFAISTMNYATLYNRKNVDAYELFFKKYLLKNK